MEGDTIFYKPSFQINLRAVVCAMTGINIPPQSAHGPRETPGVCSSRAPGCQSKALWLLSRAWNWRSFAPERRASSIFFSALQYASSRVMVLCLSAPSAFGTSPKYDDKKIVYGFDG